MFQSLGMSIHKSTHIKTDMDLLRPLEIAWTRLLSALKVLVFKFFRPLNRLAVSLQSPVLSNDVHLSQRPQTLQAGSFLRILQPPDGMPHLRIKRSRNLLSMPCQKAAAVAHPAPAAVAFFRFVNCDVTQITSLGC